VSARHWDAVYGTKGADEVSWFQRRPEVSLRLLGALPVGSVVDVGAGASVLADHLVAAGWDVTLLDVSGAALAVVRSRLGDAVRYVMSDLLDWQPERVFDAWHDRAVFHFLTDVADRVRYIERATQAVRPGGALVLGVFATDGPEQCSGLPTTRWSATQVAEAFGSGWVLEHAEREEHTTPGGGVQPFTWVVLRRG
jgi:trans-aconitate methyltransferase